MSVLTFPPWCEIPQRPLLGAFLLLLLIADVLPDDGPSKPTILTQYPLAQKCSPVKLRVRPRYSRCMRMAAFPFNRPTAFATLYLGGMLRHKCTWSGIACPSTNSIPICSQSARRILPMSLRSVPKIAFCRYCGTMMMWYRQYHRIWLWFCHARLVVSPSGGLGGSTPGETTSPFTNQRRNGRACSSLTARSGGLPVGVITLSQCYGWYGTLASRRHILKVACIG
jgi:hypothetical protein